MRVRLRRLWLLVHRWIGLTVGLLFVLAGLTGSLLVFHHAIDEWLNPELLRAAGEGTRQPLQSMLAAAEAALPEQHGSAQFVDLPRHTSGVCTVWFRQGPKEAPQFTQVYVDPHSGQVTGSRVWGEYATSWVYDLHHRLLGGQVGETVVGLTGVVLIGSVVSGIYLWWPLWRNSWRAAFIIRGGRLFQYDLHKTVGVLSAPLLLLVAFSGVYLIFPEWIKPGVNFFSRETATNTRQLQSAPGKRSAPISADRALAIAEGVFPDDELKRLYLPSKPSDPFVARVRRAGEVRRSSGNSRIWIDQYQGQVLAVRDWNARTAADSFFAWQFPLHNGEAFGLVGRWVVFLCGLAPAILYFTGCVLWWRRRRSRRRLVLPAGTPAWHVPCK